jgi:PAS domain S-box-containing protein
VLSAAVGLLLAVLLTRILGTSPVAVLLSAVALAAWYGGRRPALLTALLVLGPSLVVALSPSSGQLLPPAFSRAATLEPIQLGLAAASAVLIAAASGHLRATRATAKEAPAAEMESRAALLETPGAPADAELREIFEGLAEAVAVSDSAGALVEVNQALSDLTDYDAAELRGLRVQDLLVASSPRTPAERTEFERSGRWRGERELRRRDGTRLPVELRTRALHPGPDSLYVTVLRDIAEREARQRAQDEFIAIIGHELKVPLTLLIGWAEILQSLGTYNEHAVTTISAQAKRLNRLVSDLLDVTRLRAGRLELLVEPVDLAELLRISTAQAQSVAPRHAIRAELLEQPLLRTVDRDRIQQVLENLISNAVKYSPAGGEILLRLESVGEETRIIVRDQGGGIPAKALPHIFEPYYRGETTAGSAEGLGLGLYISRLLVEAHGGRIWAESETGRGSSFTIVLSSRDPPPTGSTTPASPTEPRHAQMRGF